MSSLSNTLAASRSMARVAIVYKTLPHYRVAFFEQLRAELRLRSIELDLIYGQPAASDATKKDAADVSWAHKIRNLTFQLGDTPIYWQPCVSRLLHADLVIVEQANKLLLNYVLLVLRSVGLVKRLAYWGHGKNFQAQGRRRLREYLKRKLVTKVDWWFTYNETSSQVVIDAGFPKERLTPVQNAIDTSQLSALRNSLSDNDIRAIQDSIAGGSRNVCLFVGSMYPDKRTQFVVDSCVEAARLLPDFHAIFLGTGVDAKIVERAAQRYSFIHYFGPKRGEEMVRIAAACKLIMMPSAVGLAVLDSFALGVPMVSTPADNHGPEIEYLRDGYNGILSRAETPEEFAQTLVDALRDDARVAKLVAGCRESAQRYTISAMVACFADGVDRALRA